MPTSTGEGRRYSFAIVGLQVRGLSRSVLCAALLVGIYSAWFMHGYCEERLSKHENFPMWPLTLIQFSSVGLLSTVSARLQRGGGAAAQLPDARLGTSPLRVGMAFVAQAVLVVLSQGVSNTANNHMPYLLSG